MNKRCTSLFVLFISFSLTLSARTFTVSNNPDLPGQYTAVSEAITAAAAGDTILIQGSPISYGSFGINKPLTLIGPGHNPQKQNPLTASCGTIALNSNDIKIFGLVVTNNIEISTNLISNITISYCRINQITAADRGSNWIVKNNIFSVLTNNGSTGILIHNNVVTGYIQYCTGSTSIKNNLFIRNGITNPSIFYAPTGGIVANNIFYNVGLSSTGIHANTIYQNNLAYIPNGTIFRFPTGNGHILQGNLENVNPLFVNVPANAGGFDYAHDYRLQANSPAKNAGNDGTDIGLYGLNPFSKTGELPQQPVIRTMSIQNPNVPSGGTLRVSATISKATTGN